MDYYINEEESVKLDFDDEVRTEQSFPISTNNEIDTFQLDMDEIAEAKKEIVSKR